MIKRVLGVLTAVATIAAIVFAVLGRNEFRSLLSDDEAASASEAPVVRSEPAERRDTTAVPAAALSADGAQPVR